MRSDWTEVATSRAVECLLKSYVNEETRMSPAALAALMLLLAGCTEQMPSNPVIDQLVSVMETNMRNTDVSEQVCPLINLHLLDEIVGYRIGEREIKKRVLSERLGGVVAATHIWTIIRSQFFQWSQLMLVFIGPDGNCSARVYFHQSL